MDSGTPWLAAIYFIALVFIGYTINYILIF